jgi:creatinine amidohydrolase
MGYHIHETGYHARWLEEQVGEREIPMTGIPPSLMLHFFLYQLRAFVNSGFRTIVVVSGHSGGNQVDLRRAAELFMHYVPVKVWVRSDPELVQSLYKGDHAGKYELSQLMYLRPDLVDMEARALESSDGSGGKMAIGDDADEASQQLGQQIMEACLDSLCASVNELQQEMSQAAIAPLTFEIIEEIWKNLHQTSKDWVTAKPWPEQAAVSEHSRWRSYEYYQDKR